MFNQLSVSNYMTAIEIVEVDSDSEVDSDVNYLWEKIHLHIKILTSENLHIQINKILYTKCLKKILVTF